MDSDKEREKSNSLNEASSDSHEKLFYDSDDDDDNSAGSSAPLVALYEDDDVDVNDLENDDDNFDKVEEKVDSAEENAISVVEIKRNVNEKIMKNIEECNHLLQSTNDVLDEQVIMQNANVAVTHAIAEAVEVEQSFKNIKIDDDVGIVFTAKIRPDKQGSENENILDKMNFSLSTDKINFDEAINLVTTARKRPSILEGPTYHDLLANPESECYFSAQDFLEYGALLTSESKTPDLESGYYERSESEISREDIELARLSKGSPNRNIKSRFTLHELTSEGLREELNRFRLMIDIMEQERFNKNNNHNNNNNNNDSMEINLQHAADSVLPNDVTETVNVEKIEPEILNGGDGNKERGYWSTVFGEASKIETVVELTLDERFANIQKAHRALELLEDYHSRLSEPQDRALRIAIERVIRIFKSRLFQALLERDYMKAYRQQTQCIQYVVKMLQQLKEENWCLPIMYTTCLDLRILARKCEDLGQRSTPGEILEKAADGLMACFRVCAADNRSSEDDTKRLGMLNLVNQLFKVYFRINKLHLCKPLIRAIESSAFRDSFPLPEQITYKYFVGRKAMFDSDYKSADDFLSFAFRHCPRQFSHNKRLILIYLVPVKMLLGYLPKKEILDHYDVLQFYELVVALKEGNVRKFDEVMQRHELWFIKCGIYLLVERLKFIVYRNLFKRVYLLRQTHQLNMNDFHAALKFVGEEDVCIDETHCIVANLIYEGKIKGYISYSHNKLVVSKQNPFPPISSVATTVP